MTVNSFAFIAEFIIAGGFVLLKAVHSAGGVDASISTPLLSILTPCIPILYLLLLIEKYSKSRSIERLFREDIFTVIICISLIIVKGDTDFTFWLASAHLLSSLFGFFERKTEKINRFAPIPFFSKLSSSKIIFLSFFLFILFGTFLLMLPISSSKENVLNFADALFMSSSAVSTTGLATISLPDDLSLFGQGVILILVQLGALGLMTFFSFLALFTGRSINLKEKLLLQDMLDVSHTEELLHLLADIVIYTLVIEIWGGIILTIAFVFEGFDIQLALYHGFFHSISAFCTAGFSTFNNSFENFASNGLINMTLTILEILGGLGFIVLQESKLILMKKKKLSHLSLHSKIVLITNTLFLICGTTYIFFAEFLTSLDQYTVFDKIQISFFQFTNAMTTAGFNSIPIGNLQPSTLFFLICIMFIGAAPGSTAGGIKITTFVILVLAMKSFFLGREKVHIYGKTISQDVIIKSIAVTLISLILIAIFFFLIMIFEPNHGFLALLFEVLSSFGTVGLSVGITASLSDAGKILLAILMFMSRVGPLTLVLAMGERKESISEVRYPQGNAFLV